jgi:gliding motility-associated-like protein
MQNLLRPLFVLLIAVLPWVSQAQFTPLSGIINDYTPVSAYNACSNSLTVGSAAAFVVGDRVLVIQMQGAIVDASESPTFGQITDLGSAGLYEFGTISAITGNVITLANGMVNTYTYTGKVQMVRVPVYGDCEVNFAFGPLVALPWNGTTGGVLVFESTGSFLIQGEMNAYGMGFRGGTASNTSDNICPAVPNLTYGLDILDGLGAAKGEGIAAFDLTISAGRGPWANGGGGGNKLNSGGGGGANGGLGGQGGYQTSSCIPNQIDNGGLGGYNLDYTGAPRAFMGGGGGSGDRNDGGGSAGGNGGGIIIVQAAVSIECIGFGVVDASGVYIQSDPVFVGDGYGGGGGGGTVLFCSPFIEVSAASILLNGGNGTDNAAIIPQDFGTGGGGGGGYINFSGPTPSLGTLFINGGFAGECLGSSGAPCINEFNGATDGAYGPLPLGGLICPEGLDPFLGYVTADLDTTLCFGEVLVVNGTTYSAANPTGDELFPLGSVDGCDSLLTITVSYFANNIGTYIDTLCPGQSVTIGGTVFNQANATGAATINNGSYVGCDSTVNVQLTYLVTGTSIYEDTLCPGETVQIGSTTFSQANPGGTTTIAGGSANGCDSIVTVDLTFQPQIAVNLSTTGAVCPGEQAFVNITMVNGTGYNIGTITVEGGTESYTFDNINSGFNFEVAPGASTTYTITDLTVAGYTCTPFVGSSAFVVVTNLNPTFNVLSDYNGYDVSCADATDGIVGVTVTGTPPYTYSWSNGFNGPINTDMPAGENSVIIADANGCTEEATIILSSPPAILFDTATTSPTCYGLPDASITIDTVYGGFSPFFISFDDQLAFPLPDSGFTYTNLEAGNFNITVYDDNDCSVSMPVYIPAPEELLVDIGNDTIINLGDSLILVLQTNFPTFDTLITWSTLDGPFAIDTNTVTIAPLYETTYLVYVTDTLTGCIAEHEMTVTISKDRFVFIPTAFSPNGDNNNDVFYIFADPKIIQTISTFRIYDRWGTLMHEALNFRPNDPNFGWNGYHRGNLVMPQVFTYFVKLTYIDGRTQEFEGDLTLMR